jgi:hypothetical protein
MAQQTFELAPWTTLKGSEASTDEIIQRRETWVDAESNKEAVVCIQVLTHTNCTLSLQTAVMPEGPWTNIANFTAATNTTKYFSSTEAATAKFQRFLRWKLDRSVANWQTGFRIEVNVL